MVEIVYSTQRSGFDSSKVYRNPRYFERALPEGVSRVTVVGNWPAVVTAYEAAGVEVVSVDGPVIGNIVPAKTAKAIKAAFPEGIGTDSGDQFSDNQLRAAIEAATGEKVHHKTGRERLVARFNEINAAKAARQDETASNGLTRREIEADLESAHVEFDPRDSVEDLAALRDMAREARGA